MLDRTEAQVGRSIALLADNYAAAVEERKRVEAVLKGAKELEEQWKNALIDAMLEEETTSIGRNGKKFSLVEKTKYSKRAGCEAELFELLRSQGMEDIITETVNANTLNATMNDIASDHDGTLPEVWDGCINSYAYTDISMRKA